MYYLVRLTYYNQSSDIFRRPQKFEKKNLPIFLNLLSSVK